LSRQQTPTDDTLCGALRYPMTLREGGAHSVARRSRGSVEEEMPIMSALRPGLAFLPKVWHGTALALGMSRGTENG